MDIKNALKDALESVKNCYPEFVECMLDDAEQYGIYQQLLDFIKDNPDAGSGDVILYFTNNFWNEENDFDEDTVFYDDEDARESA